LEAWFALETRPTAAAPADLESRIAGFGVLLTGSAGCCRPTIRISDEAAFGQLCELSQKANMKLRDVAHRLVAERTKPLD